MKNDYVLLLGMGKNPTTPLYSDTTNHEHIFGERKTMKYIKITTKSHAYKGYASSYNVEILNSFNPEIQLKNIKSGTKIKLNDLLTKLKGFKFMAALVIEFLKKRK